MTSLGRVGRILAGSIDVSNISIEKETASALLNAQHSDGGESQPSAEQPISKKSQKDDIITHQHIEKQPQIVFQGKLAQMFSKILICAYTVTRYAFMVHNNVLSTHILAHRA